MKRPGFPAGPVTAHLQLGAPDRRPPKPSDEPELGSGETNKTIRNITRRLKL